MRQIGFSTGALALGDFRKALHWLQGTSITAVELSALRDAELPVLMGGLRDLDLRRFTYIAVHAPSRFTSLRETEAANWLRPCIDRGWPVVVHPDVVKHADCWKPFGALLCVENMDKRKGTGRTANELDAFFEWWPDATLCLDVAHARQIDPTMSHAFEILRRFGDRLRQIHISELDVAGRHERLSLSTVLAVRRISRWIPSAVPAIIESRIGVEAIGREIAMVQSAFGEEPSKVAGMTGALEK